MNYEEFIARKGMAAPPAGIDGVAIADHLYPHQRDLAAWALSRGRAAVFAATGLGKTAIQLEWARHVSERGRVLILAPLAVVPQTSEEATRYGMNVPAVRDDGGQRIVITNYESLHRFDPGEFVGVVLDESSILKSYDGKTTAHVTSSFSRTPYRLCATATPSPNDFTELGTHAEFLGISTRAEMLATYFVHDGGSTSDWRIKGHARGAFWAWVASWGAVVRSPADLGYDDDRYNLPPLVMHEHVVRTSAHDAGLLFAVNATTLSEQRAVKRSTIDRRVEVAARVASETHGPVIVWCDLNDEASGVTRAVDGAVEVRGSESPEDKAEKAARFAGGDIRVLVTKPSIFGYGLNWQHCRTMVFVGASHSYEQTYQAIRRCWRFGQTSQVDVHMIRADTEQLIVDNYRRKDADATKMASEMASYVSAHVMREVRGASSKNWDDYGANMKQEIPQWLT